MTDCKECSANFISPEAAANCTAVPLGYVANSDRTRSIPCPAGEYRDHTMPYSGCKECKDKTDGEGLFRDNNMVECEKCRDGHEPDTTHGTCVPCNPGFYKDSDSNVCQPCDVGTYQAYKGQSECIDAPLGHEVTQIKQTSYKACQPGFYKNETSMNCTAVKPKLNQYTSHYGMSQYLYCTEGSEVNDGGNKCIQCNKGQYKGVHDLICINCNKTTYQSSIGQASCITPPVGFIVPEDASIHPTACAAGKYGHKNLLECIECQPALNQYTPSPGMATYLSCPLGSEVNCTSNSDTFIENCIPTHCHPCPSGKYRSESVSVCTDCPPGRYASSSSSSLCLLSPSGYAAPTLGMKAPVICPYGYYQPEAGQDSCVLCDRGYYTYNEGQSTCELGTITSSDNVFIMGGAAVLIFLIFVMLQQVMALKLLYLTLIPTIDLITSGMYLLSIPFARYEQLIAFYITFLLIIPSFLGLLVMKRKYPFSYVCPFPSFGFYEKYNTFDKLLFSLIISLPWLLLNSIAILPVIVIGLFLYVSKLIAIRSISNRWYYYWSGSSSSSSSSSGKDDEIYVDPEKHTSASPPPNTTNLNNNDDNKYNKENINIYDTLDVEALNHTIFCQVVFQSIPQLAIQISNLWYRSNIGVIKGHFSSYSDELIILLSLITSAYMSLSGLYMIFYNKCVVDKELVSEADVGLDLDFKGTDTYNYNKQKYAQYYYNQNNNNGFATTASMRKLSNSNVNNSHNNDDGMYSDMASVYSTTSYATSNVSSILPPVAPGSFSKYIKQREDDDSIMSSFRNPLAMNTMKSVRSYNNNNNTGRNEFSSSRGNRANAVRMTGRGNPNPSGRKYISEDLSESKANNEYSNVKGGNGDQQMEDQDLSSAQNKDKNTDGDKNEELEKKKKAWNELQNTKKMLSETRKVLAKTRKEQKSRDKKIQERLDTLGK